MGWIGFLVSSIMSMFLVAAAWVIIDIAQSSTPLAAQEPVSSTTSGLSLFRTSVTEGNFWYFLVAFVGLIALGIIYTLYKLSQGTTEEAG